MNASRERLAGLGGFMERVDAEPERVYQQITRDYRQLDANRYRGTGLLPPQGAGRGSYAP